VALTRAYFSAFGPIKNYKTVQYMSLEINRCIWSKEKFENMVGCIEFGYIIYGWRDDKGV
jgi:hypothetical protein